MICINEITTVAPVSQQILYLASCDQVKGFVATHNWRVQGSDVLSLGLLCATLYVARGLEII